MPSWRAFGFLLALAIASPASAQPPVPKAKAPRKPVTSLEAALFDVPAGYTTGEKP